MKHKDVIKLSIFNFMFDISRCNVWVLSIIVPKINHRKSKRLFFQINKLIWLIIKQQDAVQLKSRKVCSFQNMRDDWPCQENSSCLADEISEYFSCTSFIKHHFKKSVFVILMYNILLIFIENFNFRIPVHIEASFGKIN